jgi:hypothetical protein
VTDDKDVQAIMQEETDAVAVAVSMCSRDYFSNDDGCHPHSYCRHCCH